MFDDDFDEMPADCHSCSYCEGFSRDDGTPYCGYDGGYKNCPYFEKGKIIMSDQPTSTSSCNISIDMGEMQDRIVYAFRNTIQQSVNQEIAAIVKDQFEKQIKDETDKILQQKITDAVNVLFAQEIQIGGRWGEKAETMTREEYLLKTIGDNLAKNLDKENFDKKIAAETKSQIDKFADGVKRNVNMSVKNLFDDVMQQTLTNSVVNVLMNNETYQRLSGSMQNLIGSGK